MNNRVKFFVLLFCLLISGQDLLSQVAITGWRSKIPIADQLIKDEKFDQALRLLSEVYQGAKASGDCYWESWSGLWMGEAEYQLGNKNEAIDLTLKAKNKVETCLSKDTVDYYYLICQNLGVFNSSIGNYTKQRYFYQLAFDAALKTHGRNSAAMADAYFNLGASYARRGFWYECVAYIDSSIEISRSVGYTSGEASAVHNLAYAVAKKRDFPRAIELQKQALALTKLQEEVIKGNKNLGYWYTTMGDAVQAFKHFNIALENCYAIYPLDSDNTIDILLDMAVAHYSFGNFAEARAEILQALLYLKGSVGKDLNRKQALTYKARIWSKTGSPEEAMTAIDQALAINTQDKSLEAGAFLTKGNLLGTSGQVAEGLEWVHRALQVITPVIVGDNPFRDNPSLDMIENEDETLEILEAKGDLLYEIGVNQLLTDSYLKDALKVYQLADSLTSRMQLTLKYTRSKANLQSGTVRLYNGAIRVCEKLYRRSKEDTYLDLAFEYVEKNKFQLVAESLNSLYARGFTGVPNDLIEMERDLINEIEFLSQIDPNGVTVEQQVENLGELLEEKKARLDEIWDTLKTQFPQYYSMRKNLDFADMDRVRNEVIGAGEVGIEYFLGQEYIYAFILDKDKKDLISWKKPDNLETLVTDFRASILNKQESYWALGHELYNVLLEPLQDDIEGKKLCLITDGVLSILPFETLLTEAVRTPVKSLRKQPFLIQQYDVRYLLSGQVGLLGKLQQQDSLQRSGEILAMAPGFGFTDQPDSWVRGGEMLPPLEGALQEVRELQRRFKGMYLTGNEATKQAFLNNASNYSILHIATHTLIDDELPAFSRLVFSEAGAEPLQNELKNHEIYGLTLNADLVILSACNTGMGVFRKGEGVYSLGRAFAFAGSPNLVMTLWSVKDKTTASLMGMFYRQLEKGLDKGSALSEAKRTYLKEYSSGLLVHPYYWGGVLYSGDNETIQLDSKFRWWPRLGVVGLVFGLLLLAGVVIRRRSAP